MRVLSFGAGVQSSTLLAMAIAGEIEIDRAIFADTGWEPQATYDWLGGMTLAAGLAGIPVDVVSAGNLREDALAGKPEAWMPLHIVNPQGGAGMARRQCTKNYKLVPLKRRIREMVGPRGTATALVGISLDEAHRMRPSGLQWLTNEYPLIDRRMTRADCVRWLEQHGYSEPPKSSCLGCPYKTNGQWREMRNARPDEWADVVAFDASPAIRYDRIAGEAYVHRSLKALSQVDLSTPQERGQIGLWDDLSDGECGAFSCVATSEILPPDSPRQSDGQRDESTQEAALCASSDGSKPTVGAGEGHDCAAEFSVGADAVRISRVSQPEGSPASSTNAETPARG